MADIVRPGAPAGGPLNQGAMPQNYDLAIYKGDYVELFLNIKDSNGDPVDLTGHTPSAQLKKSYDDSSPVNFECSVTAVPGQVKIFLPSTASASLTPGDYIWDVQIAASGGRVRTYLTGDVVVYNEVTTE